MTMTWLIQLWQRFLQKLLDHLISLSVIALVGAVVIFGRNWLFSPLPIWPVVPMTLLIATLALSFFLYRHRRRRTFTPFGVHETSMNLLWWVQHDPKHWVHDRLDPYSPTHVDNLLDGPYCATKRDDGKPCLGRLISDEDETLRDKCIACGRGVFETLLGKNVAQSKVPLWQVKIAVLRALQRDARRGDPIRKGMQFNVIEL